MNKSQIKSILIGIFWMFVFSYVFRFFYLENQLIGTWGLSRPEFIISKSYTGLFLPSQINYKGLQILDIILYALTIISSICLMFNSKTFKNIFYYVLLVFVLLNVAGSIGIFYKINNDLFLSSGENSIIQSAKETLTVLSITAILAILTIYLIKKDKNYS